MLEAAAWGAFHTVRTPVLASIVLEPSHASKGKVSLPRWPETPFPQPYHLQAALCSSWPAELPVCSLLSAFYVPGAYFSGLLLIGRP